MTFCTLRRRTIVKVSLDGVCASVSLGNTSFVFQKVRASLHDWCFFLITNPGIEVTSRLFCSNSVGLRGDFIFLPQLQQIIPNSQQVLQSGDCCLDEFSQSSKISVLFKSAIKSFDSLLNFVDLLRLAQVFKE